MKAHSFLKMCAVSAPLFAVAANGTEAISTQLQACAEIENNQKRLRCFEELAADTNPVVHTQSTTKTTRDIAEAPTSPPESSNIEAIEKPAFGFSLYEQRQQSANHQERTSLTVVVSSIQEIGPGYWLITLEDGAVWRTTETRSSFRPPHIGDHIQLLKASLGGFMVKVGRQGALWAKRLE